MSLAFGETPVEFLLETAAVDHVGQGIRANFGCLGLDDLGLFLQPDFRLGKAVLHLLVRLDDVLDSAQHRFGSDSTFGLEFAVDLVHVVAVLADVRCYAQR